MPKPLAMTMDGYRVAPGAGPFQTIWLDTSRGQIECRWYPAADARTAALFVGGVGGGFDSPARGRLYPELCAELSATGTAALRVRYRIATELEEATLDVLAGLQFLAGQAIATAALVGHSFGGAVVIQAAAAAEMVRGAAALATQSYGTQPAATLGPRCAVLLAHGTDDEVLAPSCSRYVYKIAAEPKRLVLFPGARHGLDEAADEVHRLVHDWIIDTLRPPRQ